MKLRRTYVALDLPALEALQAGREVVVREPLQAFAVTAAVERELAQDDEEEREYDALLECVAHASRISSDRRRVVAALDLPVASVTDRPDGYAEVAVEGPVRRERVVSFHVDETVAHSDEDLLWYDATELDEVVRLVRDAG